VCVCVCVRACVCVITASSSAAALQGSIVSAYISFLLVPACENIFAFHKFFVFIAEKGQKFLVHCFAL
jgi:hypothetical protein